MPLMTSFQVTCADVVDEDTPLNYSLYVNYNSDALQTVTSPVFEPFTLELGSEADDYWVNITVTITDPFGAHLTVQLAVLVYEQQTTEQTTEGDVTTLGDPVTTVSDSETTPTISYPVTTVVDSVTTVANSLTTAGEFMTAVTADLEEILAELFVRDEQVALTYMTDVARELSMATDNLTLSERSVVSIAPPVVTKYSVNIHVQIETTAHVLGFENITCIVTRELNVEFVLPDEGSADAKRVANKHQLNGNLSRDSRHSHNGWLHVLICLLVPVITHTCRCDVHVYAYSITNVSSFVVHLARLV